MWGLFFSLEVGVYRFLSVGHLRSFPGLVPLHSAGAQGCLALGSSPSVISWPVISFFLVNGTHPQRLLLLVSGSDD